LFIIFGSLYDDWTIWYIYLRNFIVGEKIRTVDEERLSGQNRGTKRKVLGGTKCLLNWWD